MKYPLKAILSGDESKSVPQGATGQSEGLQVSTDIWNDEEDAHNARKWEIWKAESFLTALVGGVEQPQLSEILAALGSRTDGKWCAHH